MYLIASSLLIVIISFIAYWKKTERWRASKSEFFNFLLTLVATFIGVFLAIDFTNLSEHKKEQKNVMKLLDATILDINNCISSTSQTVNMASNDIDSLQTKYLYIQTNPLQLPKLLQSTVNNEVVLRHLSSHGIQWLNKNTNDLEAIQEQINIDPENFETTIVSSMNFYIELMELSKEVITTEKSIIEARTPEKDISKLYDELNRKWESIFLEITKNPRTEIY